MEIIVGFILGVIFNPLIMKIVMIYRNRKVEVKREFGFGYNVINAKRDL